MRAKEGGFTTTLNKRSVPEIGLEIVPCHTDFGIKLTFSCDYTWNSTPSKHLQCHQAIESLHDVMIHIRRSSMIEDDDRIDKTVLADILRESDLYFGAT